MLTRLFDALDRRAKWTQVGVVVLAAIVLLFLFDVRNLLLGVDKALDGQRHGYDEPFVRNLFSALHGIGRLAFYGRSEVTLDFVFPFVYCGLAAMLIARLYPRRFAWVLIVPVLTGLADLVENFSIQRLAAAFTAAQGGSSASLSSGLVRVASAATQTKWLLLVWIMLPIVLLGVIVKVVSGLRTRGRLTGTPVGVGGRPS